MVHITLCCDASFRMERLASSYPGYTFEMWFNGGDTKQCNHVTVGVRSVARPRTCWGSVRTAHCLFRLRKTAHHWASSSTATQLKTNSKNNMTFNNMTPPEAEQAWGRTGGHNRDAARRQATQGPGIQTAFSARTDKIELQGIDERGMLDKDIYHDDILEL